jgi:SNF2 family DNA or RNA helicase
VAPLRTHFGFRLESAQHEEMDVDTFIPIGGFPIKDNTQCPVAAQPSTIRGTLLPEQLRTLSWMQEAEGSDRRLGGSANHRARIRVPPYEDVVVHWKLSAEYALRGGVLADEIGFGKTACMVALVSQSKAAPHGAFAMAYEQRYRQYQAEHAPERNLVSTRATLVIVPSHLLHQWEGEIKKFNPELRVISVTTVTQMPKAAAVRKADIVLCSVNLFSSDKYWSKIVGVHRNAIAVSDTAARNQYEMEQVAPSPPSWSAHDGANSHKRQRYVPSFHPSILP